jgi:hypothetical protein
MLYLLRVKCSHGNVFPEIVECPSQHHLNLPYPDNVRSVNLNALHKRFQNVKHGKGDLSLLCSPALGLATVRDFEQCILLPVSISFTC